MSSCWSSGGGRSYGLNELDIMKFSPSSSSSPSSTVISGPIATRRPRSSLRKRPNQTYNEAAALLSTAYPNVFSSKHLSVRSKQLPNFPHVDEAKELLFSFRAFDDESRFPLPQENEMPKPFTNVGKSGSFCSGPDSNGGSNCSEEVEFCELQGGSDQMGDEFDAESMLDEEIMDEGIDSIMGNLTLMGNESAGGFGFEQNQVAQIGYDDNVDGVMKRRGVSPFRRTNVYEHNFYWWNFPFVDMVQISPRLKTSSSFSLHDSCSNSNVMTSDSSNDPPELKVDKKKNKKKKKKVASSKDPDVEENTKKNEPVLLLKLNYDSVLSEWSDRGSPFSEQIQGDESAKARLTEIDLFTEGNGNNGLREASVLRYKEKRRTRLFSPNKIIRYQVRKFNADTRPRMKGRFIRSPNQLHETKDDKKKKVLKK